MILHPLTIEFIAGACVGLAVRADLPRRFASFAFIVGGVTLAASFLVIVAPEQFFLGANWAREFTVGLPFALIVYGLAEGERQAAAPASLLVRIGDASYSIYLSHVLLLSALGRCFAVFPAHSIAIELAFVVFCIVAANAFGVVSFHVIERPSLRYLRGLLGGARVVREL